MSTRRAGTVAEWFDDKGYGFITPADGTGRLFFHISDVRRKDARALAGDRVTFALGTGRDGRPAAVDVLVEGLGEQPFASGSYRVYAAAVLIVAAFAAVILGGLPLWVIAAYAGMGAVSFALYWQDKAAAGAARWRTAETTLHAADLSGGVIGGLLAQHILRHKTRKQPFIVTTVAIALLHLAGLVAFAAGVMRL